MDTLIREVSTDTDLDLFINLPWKIYKANSPWVPPLKLAVKDQLDPKHPFYEHAKIKLWLAWRNECPVGRIAAVVNYRHNEFHQEQVGHFGFFECIEDIDVSQLLLKEAELFLKDLGLKKMIGPMNPSTNYECGLLIHGFDLSPQLMMTYNPKYYQEYFENYGLIKEKDLLAFDLPVNYQIPERIKHITERLSNSKRITTRFLNKKKWGQEMEFVENIYNESWDKNWGFVPMSNNEFKKLAKDLRPICEEKLVVMTEVRGEPAGFLVALPDYNQIFKTIPNGKLFPFGIFKLLFHKSKINQVRVVIMGVRPKFRNLGLGPIMYQKVTESTRSLKQYSSSELSWVLEDNLDMIKPLLVLGATESKRYRVFSKLI